MNLSKPLIPQPTRGTRESMTSSIPSSAEWRFRLQHLPEKLGALLSTAKKCKLIGLRQLTQMSTACDDLTREFLKCLVMQTAPGQRSSFPFQFNPLITPVSQQLTAKWAWVSLPKSGVMPVFPAWLGLARLGYDHCQSCVWTENIYNTNWFRQNLTPPQAGVPLHKHLYHSDYQQ